MADTKLEATIELKDKISGQLDNVNQSLSKTNNSFSNLTGTIIKANLATEVIKKSFNLVGDIIGGVVNKVQSMTRATKDFFMESLDMAGALEQNRMALDVMIGSADRASQLLVELSKFAKKTPFNLADLQGYTKQLIAFGYSADDIIPILTKLGNVASGVGMDKLPNIVYAMGQVKVAGRLMGQELLQFTNAGVPLIDALSKTMGIAKEKVREYVEQGKVGYPEVERAMASLSSEGGKFNGLMDRQSTTFFGLKSNFEDFMDSLKRRIGGIDEAGNIIEGGLLDKVRNGFTLLNEKLGENSGIVDKVAGKLSTMAGGLLDTVIKGAEAILSSEKVKGAFEKLKDEIGNVMEKLGLTREQFGLTDIDQDELAENMATGIIDKVTKLVEGFGKFIDWINNNKEGIKQFGKDLATIASAVASVVNALIKLGDWFTKNEKVLRGIWAIQSLGLSEVLINRYGTTVSPTQQKVNENLDSLNKNLGKKATGTMYSQGGLTLVGERGAELVNLPRGSKVTPNESVRGQGGTVNINIDVSGAMITNQEAFIERLTGEISRAISNQSRLNMYGIQ